jgi:hypothetical protein
VDGTIANLSIYLAANFAAALVTGIAGFAFGLVAAAVWLHILTPLQTATLIIAFGLVVQGISVWKLRRAPRWNRLWPFLVGAAVGRSRPVASFGRRTGRAGRHADFRNLAAISRHPSTTEASEVQ